MAVELTRDGGDIVMRGNIDETVELRWTTPDWNTFAAGITGDGGQTAVELARGDDQDTILVRGILRFTSVEWHAFVHGLRDGEFSGSGIPGGSWKASSHDR